MLFDWIRRQFVLLILLLAVGVAGHSIHAANLGAETMVAPVNCVSNADQCDRGDDHNAVLLSSCSSFNCNAAPAVQGASISVEVLPTSVIPVAAFAMTGRKDPPDPYPPRPTILS